MIREVGLFYWVTEGPISYRTGMKLSHSKAKHRWAIKEGNESLEAGINVGLDVNFIGLRTKKWLVYYSNPFIFGEQ